MKTLHDFIVLCFAVSFIYVGIAAQLAKAEHIPCLDHDTAIRSLETEYNERRVAWGISEESVVEFLVSPAGTFTVIATRPDGCTMPVFSGTDWTDDKSEQNKGDL